MGAKLELNSFLSFSNKKIDAQKTKKILFFISQRLFGGLLGYSPLIQVQEQ